MCYSATSSGTSESQQGHRGQYAMYLRLIKGGHVNAYRGLAKRLAEQNDFDLDELDSAITEGEVARDRNHAEMERAFDDWREQTGQTTPSRRTPVTSKTP